MVKRDDMISGATLAFDTQGFRGTGVDSLLAPSKVSTRTLYKHFGSRDGLVLAVLDKRHRDFMDLLRAPGGGADPVGQLFDVLEHWLIGRGARGCMLLRARGEYAQANTDVVDLVRRQKEEFEGEVGKRVEKALGHADPELTRQVWCLFEGATAAASVSTLAAVGSAKGAAEILVKAARGRFS